MKINSLENQLIDWAKVPSERTNGSLGYVVSKHQGIGDINIRLNTYSANYEADHWCSKGHIVFVQKGVLLLEFSDRSVLEITAGNSSVIGDDLTP